MEVHHHSRHGKKKWTEYLLEFFMLFLAVFLGFIAENIREGTIENHRAKEYAEALVNDLARDTVALNNQGNNYRIYITVVDSLLALDEQRLTQANSGKFRFYSRFTMWAVALSWNRVTIDQLKNSGGLRYFKNYSLVEKITAYDIRQRVFEIEYEQHRHRANICQEFINKIIEPQFHEQVSKILIYDLDTLSSRTINSLAENRSTSLLEKKEEIKELLNMCIVQKRNLKIALQRHFPEMKAKAKDLIEYLKKEYHLK